MAAVRSAGVDNTAVHRAARESHHAWFCGFCWTQKRESEMSWRHLRSNSGAVLEVRKLSMGRVQVLAVKKSGKLTLQHGMMKLTANVDEVRRLDI